jgi:hypothetical protein
MSTITATPALASPNATPRAARWKPWLWRPINQTIALSNARGASIKLSRQRVEREAADIFVARLNTARGPRRGNHRP